jgi:phosphoglycolate phosphatase-like HAD superfamily hydrolase
MRRQFIAFAAPFLLLVFGAGCKVLPQADPLVSWNDGPAKESILAFVKQVTDGGNQRFVQPSERIAVFDNDGTLWCEQPMYFQFTFAMDQIRAKAAQHPEWKEKQPFKGVLENDMAAVAASGEKGMMELMREAHAGLSTEEFERRVKLWLSTSRHPRYKRAYTELVYQPMIELLRYLRANGFKTYIVTGGEADFVRPWAEYTYGVPPEHVVGSTMKTRLLMRDGKPVIESLNEIDFIDDKEGKPLGIHRAIGRRPIAAFGNSDGDLQMLQWTTMDVGLRFGMLVHHTDADREFAYDRQSSIGRLDKALDEARARGWVLADMKRDWKVIFPFEMQ